VLECVDNGQAYRFMAKAALRAAENFRFFADKCTEARDGQSTPSDEHWNISTRVPIGPVGVITPWNTPFMLSTWKIAPALAAGCTVVHKPAEWSPITAQWLPKLAKEAGPAAARYNDIHRVVSNLAVFGLGPDDEMELVSVHPGVTVDEVREATGFALAAAAEVPTTREPSPEEQILIREVLDPKGLRFKEVPQP